MAKPERMTAKKHSYITVNDFFCGVGGSSSGAKKALQRKVGASGFKIQLAMNHWKLAIESHSENFQDTEHVCTDIQASDPRWFPASDILLASPECTNHSLAKGTKAVKAQLKMFENGQLDPSAERSRATMWDVPRFAECYYRVLKANEVKKAMAFDDDYIIKGDAKNQVKQLGNAVTPPAMDFLVGRVVDSLM